MNELDVNYTRLSNDIIEALSRTNLSAYEWRVIMVIFRKTYGYHKKNDWIALSQIVEMSGIHKSHVSRAKKLLVQRNIVTLLGNQISFNKYHTQWRELPKGVTTHHKLPKGVIRVTEGGNRELPKGAHTKESITKENIQKKLYLSDKGINPSVEKIMIAMKDAFGILDKSEKVNRHSAHLLIQKAMKFQNGISEEEAVNGCVALIQAAKNDPWWGNKITSVPFLYNNVMKIIGALKTKTGSSNKIFIIS